MTSSGRHQTISNAVLVFALSALLRLTYLVIFRPSFDSVYWSLSTSLLHNGSLSIDGIRVTDFEPLYPIFLGGMRLLLGDHPLIVQGGQAVVASLGAVFVYLLGHALTGRERTAVIAASLYAIDPLLIRQAPGASDLALATVLLAMFAYCFVTSERAAQMAATGAILGLLVLTRSMILPLVPLTVAVLLAQRRMRGAFALTLAALMLVVPFALRNRVVNGSWAPTRSGLNLYIGNSPMTSAVLPDYDVDILEEQAGNQIDAQLSHLPVTSPEYSQAADALLTKYAVDYMTERPWETLRQKTLNIAYFFSPRLVPFYVAGPDTRAIDLHGRVIVEHPLPRPMLESLSYSLFYTPVLFGAMWGVYLSRRARSRAAILWCIVGTFTTIHAMYFPATRYRAPMEFVLLLYAAVALDYVANARRLTDVSTANATVMSDERSPVVSKHLAILAVAVAVICLGLAAHGQQPAAPGGQPTTNLGSDTNGNPLRLALKTGHVSNYDESKVRPYVLPDPLVLGNAGRVRDARSWRTRRAEILRSYDVEIYGRVPANAPTVKWQVGETDRTALTGTAILRHIVGTMGTTPAAPRINLSLYTPVNAKGPVPVILMVNFGGGDAARGRGDAARGGADAARGRGVGGAPGPGAGAEILARGWGYATVGYQDIQPDRANAWTEGVIGLTLSPGQTQPAPDEWGTIGAWSWGISRIVDYLQTDKLVDAKLIAIQGHSRLGKTVLWAAAKDERIAAVFSSCGGEMGSALARRDWGETVDDMAQNYGWQFAGNFQKWVGRWDDMPVDAHMLIALSAPRPVFVSGGTTDQ